MWGTEAIYSMVEIYINPDDDNWWDRPVDQPQENADAVHAAIKLLGEVGGNNRIEPKHKILEAYTNMATFHKAGLVLGLGVDT